MVFFKLKQENTSSLTSHVCFRIIKFSMLVDVLHNTLKADHNTMCLVGACLLVICGSDPFFLSHMATVQ